MNENEFDQAAAKEIILAELKEFCDESVSRGEMIKLPNGKYLPTWKFPRFTPSQIDEMLDRRNEAKRDH